METINVVLPIQFILEAHKSACSEWKEKIEKHFPSVFDTDIKIKEYIEQHPVVLYSYIKICLDSRKKEISINLPNANNKWANNKWTESVFQWFYDFKKWYLESLIFRGEPFIDWEKTFEYKKLIICF